jgi:hypothetical protein
LLEKLVNGRSIELRIARRDKLREHIQLIDQFLVKMPSALVVGKEALTIGRLIELSHATKSSGAEAST